MQSGQKHTTSYYAASANDQPDFTALQGDVSADVCVVGAGFTGIATALTLAERGFDVRVIEANRVGWGASGRNGGQIIAGISGETRLLKKNGPQFADKLWEMRWSNRFTGPFSKCQFPESFGFQWARDKITLNPVSPL